MDSYETFNYPDDLIKKSDKLSIRASIQQHSYRLYFPDCCRSRSETLSVGRNNAQYQNMTSDPRVRVNCGILEGYVCENETDPGKTYFSFQGIPYAKPPLGELRFKVGIIIYYWMLRHTLWFFEVANCPYV